MAVFRIEKNKNYTVMSNHHLRNKELSLRSKGLLSLMLSLPEEWDYTLKGLSIICKEGIDAIRVSIIELEKQGYIERHRKRNSKGPTVIRAMYDAVENMGFVKGNILEPSMGVGNFFGMLPQSMRESNLYGIELDNLTGRIAKQLYPKADITIAGFETTDRRDFYDLAVGNAADIYGLIA